MGLEPTIHRLHDKYILLCTYTCAIRSVSIFLKWQKYNSELYKTSVLKIDYLWMYVISSPWVIKLWEFSLPKLKIKNYPIFLDFENLRFPLKKYPFLVKWVRAWMYALVETGGIRQAWGVPSGVLPPHCNDVIMGSMASQLTNLTIVYSTIYLAADQSKHQSSVSLAFVRGIHRGPCSEMKFNDFTSTVYWCIASKLKAPRNLYWMSNMFLWVEIFIFFVWYHVVPKRHSQLGYKLNGL